MALRMEGRHILGTLEGCSTAQLIDVEGVLACVRKSIDAAGLSRVGEVQHVFSNGAYTAVICLAESHLALHTWVTERMVTLDVFVCNVTKDQSAAAKRVFDDVAAIFAPTNIRVQDVER